MTISPKLLLVILLLTIGFGPIWEFGRQSIRPSPYCVSETLFHLLFA
jgi:hypothetical protein